MLYCELLMMMMMSPCAIPREECVAILQASVLMMMTLLCAGCGLSQEIVCDVVP